MQKVIKINKQNKNLFESDNIKQTLFNVNMISPFTQGQNKQSSKSRRLTKPRSAGFKQIQSKNMLRSFIPKQSLSKPLKSNSRPRTTKPLSHQNHPVNYFQKQAILPDNNFNQNNIQNSHQQPIISLYYYQQNVSNQSLSYKPPFLLQKCLKPQIIITQSLQKSIIKDNYNLSSNIEHKQKLLGHNNKFGPRDQNNNIKIGFKPQNYNKKCKSEPKYQFTLFKQQEEEQIRKVQNNHKKNQQYTALFNHYYNKKQQNKPLSCQFNNYLPNNGNNTLPNQQLVESIIQKYNIPTPSSFETLQNKKTQRKNSPNIFISNKMNLNPLSEKFKKFQQDMKRTKKPLVLIHKEIQTNNTRKGNIDDCKKQENHHEEKTSQNFQMDKQNLKINREVKSYINKTKILLKNHHISSKKQLPSNNLTPKIQKSLKPLQSKLNQQFIHNNQKQISSPVANVQHLVNNFDNNMQRTLKIKNYSFEDYELNTVKKDDFNTVTQTFIHDRQGGFDNLYQKGLSEENQKYLIKNSSLEGLISNEQASFVMNRFRNRTRVVESIPFQNQFQIEIKHRNQNSQNTGSLNNQSSLQILKYQAFSSTSYLINQNKSIHQGEQKYPISKLKDMQNLISRQSYTLRATDYSKNPQLSSQSLQSPIMSQRHHKSTNTHPHMLNSPFRTIQKNHQPTLLSKKSKLQNLDQGAKTIITKYDSSQKRSIIQESFILFQCSKDLNLNQAFNSGYNNANITGRNLYRGSLGQEMLIKENQYQYEDYGNEKEIEKGNINTEMNNQINMTENSRYLIQENNEFSYNNNRNANTQKIALTLGNINNTKMKKSYSIHQKDFFV